MGRVTQVFPSKYNKVRKVEAKVFKKEGPTVSIRPITKTILLLTPEKLDLFSFNCGRGMLPTPDGGVCWNKFDLNRFHV